MFSCFQHERLFIISENITFFFKKKQNISTFVYVTIVINLKHKCKHKDEKHKQGRTTAYAETSRSKARANFRWLEQLTLIRWQDFSCSLNFDLNVFKQSLKSFHFKVFSNSNICLWSIKSSLTHFCSNQDMKLLWLWYVKQKKIVSAPSLYSKWSFHSVLDQC